MNRIATLPLTNGRHLFYKYRCYSCGGGESNRRSRSLCYNQKAVKIVRIEFLSYKPQVGDVSILFEEVLTAFLKHIERSINGFTKMSVSYEVSTSAVDNVVFTLSPCITVAKDDAVLDPGFIEALYLMIKNATNSPSSSLGHVNAIILRVYIAGMKDFSPFQFSSLYDVLQDISELLRSK